MAARRLAVGLLALCLVASCAAGDSAWTQEKEKLQNLANDLTLTVAKVRDTIPWKRYAEMEQIIKNILDMAGAWYQIDSWSDPQSNWDNLSQLANAAIAALNKALPGTSTKGKPPLEWGSQNPLADLTAVRDAICKEMANLQDDAVANYEVDPTVVPLAGCPNVATTGTVGAKSIEDGVGAPAPAPAADEEAAPAPAPEPEGARRLLRRA